MYRTEKILGAKDTSKSCGAGGSGYVERSQFIKNLKIQSMKEIFIAFNDFFFWRESSMVKEVKVKTAAFSR